MTSAKKRIPVSGPQLGLNAAFAGLNLEGLPEATPESPQQPALLRPGRVLLRRSTAHRGGKVVIVVEGFAGHHSEEWINALGGRIRAVCGCGGTVRGRTLEIQGDQLGKVRAALEAEGFSVGGEK
jgi:translation initiation factor 1